MSEDDEIPMSEMDGLKDRANRMGLKYRKHITLDNLRSKVADVLADKESANEAQSLTKPSTKALTENEQRVVLKQEAAALTRIRVTCMDPNKREYDGDFFCAGNRIIGTYKVYVPFDVEWHVPSVILKMIRRKQCQVFVSKRDERGRQIREGKSIKAFAVEVLPALTEQEMQELAQRQAMSKGTAAA
jgi:hypothetical protein